MEVLDKIPDVHLDAGTFKYVLISATFNGAQKHIVRGFEGPKYEYHIDVFNECVRQARDMLPEDGEDGSSPWCRCDGALSSRKQTTQRRPSIVSAVQFTCVGGGRIQHEPRNKSIFIYGYSVAFGKADHAAAAALCNNSYGSQYKITFSDEGY